jgi:Uma2 family endonuclease
MSARTILTYDGIQLAPEDGLRRELLGGDLYVSPAPTPLHQSVVTELIVALNAYAKVHGGKTYPAPIDVVFSQTDAVQPDVVYVGRALLSIVGPKNIQGAPSLLVEVMSPSSSDVDPVRKLATYARHGVPEYWIVDPATRSIAAYAGPTGERYHRMATSVGGTIEALTLPDLRFSLAPANEAE